MMSFEDFELMFMFAAKNEFKFYFVVFSLTRGYLVNPAPFVK